MWPEGGRAGIGAQLLPESTAVSTGIWYSGWETPLLATDSSAYGSAAL